MTELRSMRQIEATCIENSTLFHTFDLVLVDSTVERTSSDTTTRVRFVRATTAAQSTYEATETRTEIDTVSEKGEEIETIPNAGQSIKNGVAKKWGDPDLWFMVLLLIFFIVVILSVKKCLPLRRQ